MYSLTGFTPGVSGFASSSTKEALDLLTQWGAPLQTTMPLGNLLLQYFQEIWDGWNDIHVAGPRSAIASDAVRETLPFLPLWIGREPTQAEKQAWTSLFTMAGLWVPSDEGGGFMQALKGLGSSFRDLTQSPVWKIVAIAVNVVPGIGTAVSAGMVAAAAVGKATSVEDVIVGAGRAVVPGGDAGKAGYDAATGILVQGKPIDEVSLQFVRDQLKDPKAQIAFDYAVALQAGIKAGTPPPPGLSAAGEVAFFTAHGSAVVGATPTEMANSHSILTKSPIVTKAATINPGVMTGIKSGYAAGVDAAYESQKQALASQYLTDMRSIMRKARAGDEKSIAYLQDVNAKYKAGDQAATLQIQMLATADRANRELDGAVSMFNLGLPGAWETLKATVVAMSHKVRSIFVHDVPSHMTTTSQRDMSKMTFI